MRVILKILCFVLSASWVHCFHGSVAGISYMDPINQKQLELPRGTDPCKPLYWYPRPIPEYCHKKFEVPLPPPIPPPPPPPLPAPPISIPIPVPIPLYQVAIAQPIPQYSPPGYPIPVPMPGLHMPGPPIPGPPLPYGIPGSFPGYHYPAMPPSPPQMGFVPGVPNIVSEDGGINILPFSDAYSDMLEKHKQKVIRKKLQKVLDDYENYPRWKKHRKHIRRRY